MASKFQRRLLGAAFVACASATTAFAVRRFHPPTVESAPDYRIKGPSPAKVVIVEYSDFQCPACKVAEPVIKQLMDLYGKDTRFIFKNFPLDRPHPYARAAAWFAECAGRQGRFWPVHDLLYERQELWSQDPVPAARFQDYARELKLDGPALDACLKDPETQKSVDADEKEGDDRWVYSTPTFFVNQKRFVGARQLMALSPSWIERQIKEKTP